MDSGRVTNGKVTGASKQRIGNECSDKPTGPCRPSKWLNQIPTLTKNFCFKELYVNFGEDAKVRVAFHTGIEVAHKSMTCTVVLATPMTIISPHDEAARNISFSSLQQSEIGRRPPAHRIGQSPSLFSERVLIHTLTVSAYIAWVQRCGAQTGEKGTCSRLLQPREKGVKKMVKTVLVLAAASAALGAGVAYAGIGARDVYTDGSSVMGPRDPYTDGSRTAKFDVYSQGTKVTDRRDVFTDGGRVTSRDGLVEDGM